MQWKDLFYFSHGERRALSLLLFLISIAWVLLYFPDFKKKEITEIETTLLIPDTIKRNMSPKHPPYSPVQHASKETEQASKKERITQKPPMTYSKQEKFAPGTIIELNSADTTTLKKVPGIGSAFANRIIKYRDLLGGFYTVDQLSEVYGIDEDRFHQLKNWFYTDTTYLVTLDLNQLTEAELRKHPYINSRQAKTIVNLRNRKGIIEVENLILLEEFTEVDRERLRWYYLTTPGSESAVKFYQNE